MLFLVLRFVLVAAVALASDRVFLPKPYGKYHVGKTQHVLNHTTYNDPLAPEGSNNTGTFILVTILYPTTKEPTASTSLKYMDYELAHLIEQGWGIPEGEIQKLWTHIQWQPPTLPGHIGKNKRPSILFSPGAGMPCSSGTVITSDLVSEGYTIVCIDHPGEAPYLEIPFGEGVYGLPIDYEWPLDTETYQIYNNRKTDFDALLEAFPFIVQEFNAPFNTSTWFHCGFSMGGSFGSYPVARHDQVIAGLNYDGSFVDSIYGNTTDVKKPFFIFRSNRHTYDDTPYGQSFGWFEGNQTGWWEEVRVNGSYHLDISDVSMWYEQLDLYGRVNSISLGTIAGSRIRYIQRSFTLAFYDLILGKDVNLFDGSLPSAEWPEVIYINSSSRATI